MTLYALVYLVCLQSSGQCEAVVPEVYTEMTACVMEVSHQRKSGVPAERVYCEEIKEESEELFAEN